MVDVMVITLVHDCHLDCVAIVHDHFYAHIQMENELNTNRYNLIVDYLMIDDTLVLLDVIREMCSTAAIKYSNINLALEITN